MIKAMLDTNIVLDALTSREPFAEDAQNLFRLAENGVFNAFLSANTITDIYYISRKRISESMVRMHLSNLMKIFKVLPVGETDCKNALDSKINDYEDSLLFAIVGKASIQYIITRDKDFLAECEKQLIQRSFY